MGISTSVSSYFSWNKGSFPGRRVKRIRHASLSGSSEFVADDARKGGFECFLSAFDGSMKRLVDQSVAVSTALSGAPKTQTKGQNQVGHFWRP